MTKENNPHLVFHLNPDLQLVNRKIALAKMLKDSFSMSAAKTSDDMIALSRMQNVPVFINKPFNHFIGGTTPAEMVENATRSKPRCARSMILISDSAPVILAARNADIPAITFTSSLRDESNNVFFVKNVDDAARTIHAIALAQREISNTAPPSNEPARFGALSFAAPRA